MSAATIAEAFGTRWLPVKDGDARAYALYRRHYSAKPGKARPTGSQRLIVGPGEKYLLLTPDGAALFVWRKFISDDGQRGVNCAVFRNEGPHQSSSLIREASQLAWRRWPGERLYTYVDASKIASPNPGYCFKEAGWVRCGESKGGLDILEIYP